MSFIAGAAIYLRRELGAAAVLLVCLAQMAVESARGPLTGKERFVRRDFARAVERTVPPGAPMVALCVHWENEVYYLHRAIPVYAERGDLLRAVEGERCYYEIIDSRYPPDIPPGCAGTAVVDLPYRDFRLQLWKIEAP